MQELMIHVERIVRPVRAFASLKLQMRRELLTHLQSAVAEEQAHGADEEMAIQRAKERLGKPAELTAALGRSVPRVQQILMARVPAPSALDRFEILCQRFRLMQRMTLMHGMLLLGSVVVLSVLALISSAMPLIVDRSALAGDVPLSRRILLLLAWIAANALAVAGCGFVSFASANSNRFHRRLLSFAGIVVGMQLLWTLTIAITFGGGRTLHAVEFAPGLGIGLATVVILLLVARLLGKLRRPYDQWLTLDLR